MENMLGQSQRNRGNVLAWVGIGIGTLSVVLGILPYIHPPDPAHPLRFDFIFQKVSFPLWGTVLGIIAIAGGAYGIGIRKSRRAFSGVPPIDAPKPSPSTVKAPNSKPIAKAVVPQVATRLVSHNREEFSFETPDHYTVRIRRLKDRDTNGLVLSIVNNRLETLGKITITIFSAQSFSVRHGKFREPFGFPAARMGYQGNILADTSGLALWIVRKEESKGYLLAADDQSHPMNWPDGDPVELQIWRMRLEVTSQTIPVTSGIAPIAFSTQPFNVIVIWNSTTNEFFFGAETDEEKP
jgi:hypothetical protein